MTERFTETILNKNILEFHKGNSLDGELLLTNKNVKGAEKTTVDYGGYEQWCVAVKLDDAGSQVFADATAELAGTNTPISIWLDNELLYAPLITTKITDGNVIISGDFDDQSSNELAEKIRSMPLPYDVTIDAFEFGAAK